MTERAVVAADDDTTRFAMKIFMASWTFSFVALLVAYAVLRHQAAEWPPSGLPRPPLLLTALSTVFAISSSMVLQLGIRNMQRGHPASMAPALAMAAALGAVFLVCQIMAGVQAWGWGLRPVGSAYGAIFWVTAIFHAVHVVVGVVALSVLYRGARRRGLDSGRRLTIELWSYFWHSIDAAWLAIFVVMFVPY
jgi:heme/copper-type cytochrome/quinol oxidase subunit 3